MVREAMFTAVLCWGTEFSHSFSIYSAPLSRTSQSANPTFDFTRGQRTRVGGLLASPSPIAGKNRLRSCNENKIHEKHAADLGAKSLHLVSPMAIEQLTDRLAVLMGKEFLDSRPSMLCL